MAHYGLEARTIHLSSPNENGDVESSNGGLKGAVRQAATHCSYAVATSRASKPTKPSYSTLWRSVTLHDKLN